MPSGDQVTSFSLAVGSQWKDKSGEKQESTEWVNCTAFGKLAEIISKYVKKGDQIFLSGRMKTEKYQDKSGQDKYSTKIVADRMQMLGGKRNSEAGDSAPYQPAPSSKPTGGAPNGFDDMDDDIPFLRNDSYLGIDCINQPVTRAKRRAA